MGLLDNAFVFVLATLIPGGMLQLAGAPDPIPAYTTYAVWAAIGTLGILTLSRMGPASPIRQM